MSSSAGTSRGRRRARQNGGQTAPVTAALASSSGTVVGPAPNPTQDPKTAASSSTQPQTQTASTSSATSTSSPAIKRKYPVLQHKFEKRRLPKTEWEKKKRVLAKFSCPFDARCKMAEKCFFSHKSSEEDSNIKKLPSYACVMHISGSCCQIPYPRKNQDRMRCGRGFHLSYDELENLPQFEETHSAELKEEMCPVCFEHLALKNKQSKEAYMVNCRHIFCLKCITECFKNKQECPMCRTSGPFIPAKTKPTTKAKKAALRKFKGLRADRIIEINEFDVFEGNGLNNFHGLNIMINHELLNDFDLENAHDLFTDDDDDFDDNYEDYFGETDDDAY